MRWRRGTVPGLIVAAMFVTACTRPSAPPSVLGSDGTAARVAALSPVPAPPPSTESISATEPLTESAAPVPVSTASPDVSEIPSPVAAAGGAPADAPAPRRVRLSFVGDILPHSPLWRGAGRIAAADGRDGYDFRPMFADIAPLLDQTDLAVCHLETPIAPEGERFTTAPIYGVPPEVVDAIAGAGFDHCSTASNHALDRGTAGIDRTIEVLEAAGLTQSGMARTPGEIAPRLIDVDGLAVALLSYTWSFNGIPLPRGQSWRSALIDPDRIVRDAATARERGADLVVASLHWGAEQVHEPTSYQRDIADRITEAGVIDLVVGHHAHVLQPIEQVNGTWVLYGLSNILSNLPASPTWTRASQDAAVAVVPIDIDVDGALTVARPELHPTWVDKDAEWTIRFVADELRRTDLPDGRRAALEASWERTQAVVGGFVVVPEA